MMNVVVLSMAAATMPKIVVTIVVPMLIQKYHLIAPKNVPIIVS